jgi:hypothetical protein
MKIAFIALLVVIYMSNSLSFQPIRSKWLVAKASLSSTTAPGTASFAKAEGLNTLLSLPKNSFKLDKVVETIHEWGMAQSETGSAITSMVRRGRFCILAILFTNISCTRCAGK